MEKNDFMEWLDEILKYGVSHAKEALQSNGDRIWSSCSLEYDKLSKKIGSDEELLEAFSLIMNEILLLQMHTFLVAMDGGEWISEKYRFDIVDKENASIMNEEIALHEEFIDYLWKKYDSDPFRRL